MNAITTQMLQAIPRWLRSDHDGESKILMYEKEIRDCFVFSYLFYAFSRSLSRERRREEEKPRRKNGEFRVMAYRALFIHPPVARHDPSDEQRKNRRRCASILASLSRHTSHFP